MQIAFHIGAHCTDDGQVIRSLGKNADLLAQAGVVMPDPKVFRQVIREAQMTLQGAPAGEDMQDAMLEAMGVPEGATRLLLSHENLICLPQRALDGGRLYENAGEKSTWLRNLFPTSAVSFHVATCDPATYLPALRRRVNELDGEAGAQAFDQRLAALDVSALIWAEVIGDIRAANPDSPVTVWCNEDTPLLWPALLRELAGTHEEVRLKGGLDMVSKIMAHEGMKRLRAFMGDHPPKSEAQRQRIVLAFLDKYALDEAIHEEIDLPGWDESLIEGLGAAYDADMAEVARIEGVTLLTP